MKKSFVLYLLLGCFIAFAVSCASSKVARVDTGEVTDLSGKWNDTDSRLVAEEMIKDALGRPWLQTYIDKNGKNPTVVVGSVMNKSHEHINVQTFVKDLERELINSGKVDFVASKEERAEVREERKDQATGFADSSTAKEFGKEIGADFMLKGAINTMLDEVEGTKVMSYQVNMELINIETNQKAWIGDKKIKKVITRSAAGF